MIATKFYTWPNSGVVEWKNLQWCDGQKANYIDMNFPWNLNSDKKIINASWPCVTYIYICHEKQLPFPSDRICVINPSVSLTTLGRELLTHWGQGKMNAILQMTFWNGFSWMKIHESGLRFVPKVRIYYILALVWIMAWRRPGDKPLPEPMMVCLLAHIWVTRHQWVKQCQSQMS